MGNVKYKIWFKSEVKTKEDVQIFSEQIAVKMEDVKIYEDLGSIVLEFTSLFIWKIIIMDRSFSEGAEMVLVSK